MSNMELLPTGDGQEDRTRTDATMTAFQRVFAPIAIDSRQFPLLGDGEAATAVMAAEEEQRRRQCLLWMKPEDVERLEAAKALETAKAALYHQTGLQVPTGETHTFGGQGSLWRCGRYMVKILDTKCSRGGILPEQRLLRADVEVQEA
ncbi:unnamed protein product [Vitrella brassicaformis CCMP3155]|uniref:Uncharacterized protein n=1 Tax=Vitrella brassicaformis (strain CCMP3155) TaxID=1169540 RepID=A0A0G4FHJ2_VITBC|nr:unnamed protein product [Vitrella brassicaformis CCMP3155]|eukprot:CEM12928.1 unnamed protein product [Vitrella brassicaformis CCMP3155]